MQEASLSLHKLTKPLCLCDDWPHVARTVATVTVRPREKIGPNSILRALPKAMRLAIAANLVGSAITPKAASVYRSSWFVLGFSFRLEDCDRNTCFGALGCQERLACVQRRSRIVHFRPNWAPEHPRWQRER